MEAKRKCDNTSNDAGVPAYFEFLGWEDEFFVEKTVEQGQNEDHYGSDNGKTNKD